MLHTDGAEHMDYVCTMKSNLIAKEGKNADLKHKSDLSRMKTINQKALCEKKNIRKLLNC